MNNHDEKDFLKIQKQEKEKQLEEKRKELKKIILEEEYKEQMYNEKKQIKKPIITNILLSIMLVFSLIFSAFLIIDSTDRIDELYEVTNAVLILLIVITIIISFPKTLFKNKTGPTVITSILVIIAMTFNILYLFNIIKLPTQSHIIDFKNQKLTNALNWTEENKIDHKEVYEYSDNVKKYEIISQDIKPNTLTKKFKNVNFTVSNGPDYNKKVILQDMSGLTTDEIINFVDKNFLKNVAITFEENTDIKRDTIIKQNLSGNVKRSDEVIFTASLGDPSTLGPIKLKELKNQKLLNALTYLGKNKISYEINYEFSNKIEKGKIIKTDKPKAAVLNPNDKIIVTVSKGKEIKVPKLENKTLNQITKWIIENNLQLEYSDQYNNDIKKGRAISANYKQSDIIEEETTVSVVFSKGKLKMPKFKDLNSFKNWANTYNIKYEIKEEYNKDIEKDKIIKFSIKENELININEPIIVYVSLGEAINTPDFIGKTKNEIQKECNNIGITCSFANVLSDKKEGTAVSQSIAKGTEISKGTNILIDLATNNQNKVTVKKEKQNSNKSSNSNNYVNNQNNNHQNNNQQNNQTDTCSGKKYTIMGLTNIFRYCKDYEDCANKIIDHIKKEYPGVTVIPQKDDGSSGKNSGSYVGGQIKERATVECGKSYTIILAR